MNKLPVDKGKLYRGMAVTKEMRDRLVASKSFSIDKLSSATKVQPIAWDFIEMNRSDERTQGILLVLDTTSGRNLGKLVVGERYEEHEVVLGSQRNAWQITKVASSGNNTTIYAKEKSRGR